MPKSLYKESDPLITKYSGTPLLCINSKQYPTSINNVMGSVGSQFLFVLQRILIFTLKYLLVVSPMSKDTRKESNKNDKSFLLKGG